MLIRKLFRTAWSYKAQFISMIIMITLGMGMFLGFNMEWKTIEVDTGKFFEETNYADFRLYSEKGFTEIMDSMVIILVIAAAVLGIVVLYNLGIMSYVERSRELATLKVLGFRNRAIGKLLVSQNIWLTFIGVVIGLPAGVGVLQWLLTALAGEYEMKLMLGPLTYGASILLTFGVSLLVSLMVAKKNKKIDMVEALKGAE